MKADTSVRWIDCLVLLTALSFVTVVEAAPGAWTDPAGDVTLPNADIVSGSANVSAGLVDLRVQFSARPFPTTATHHVSWCLDTDQNGATGSACGFSTFLGADRGFTMFGGPDALSTCSFSQSGNVPGFLATSQVWFDPATNTLRLVFPLVLISVDAVFNYAVESAFGGSFGNNERAPDSVNFGSPGGFFTNDVGGIPPFNGARACGPDLTTIDIKPGSFPNTINPRSEGGLRVAVLTTDAFDAATVDPTTIRFGATGAEAAPVQSALDDVDGDGDMDLVLKFNAGDSGIKCGDIAASLTGRTFGGRALAGSDSIKTVGCQ